MEHDHFVQTVAEFRAEHFVVSVHHAARHGFVYRVGIFIANRHIAEADVAFADAGRADVARHNDDGVLEIHRAALRVGEAAIIENLQQRIENFRMRFFDFVEQNHRIRATAHGFGQLPAFIITDVARRRANHPAHIEVLGVLAHIKTHERTFIIEQEFGEGTRHPQLAHVSSAEGILVAERLAGQDVRPINYDHVPGCTYCDPEIGSVGLTEKAARDRGVDVQVGSFPFRVLARARMADELDGFVKIVADKKYDEILGVHIIGPRATELVAEAVLALRTECTVEELIRTIHAHPTMSEAVGEAAHATHGAAIHM